MTLSVPRSASKVNLLPKDFGTLSRDLPPARPDTLFVLGANGGMSVAPDADFALVFGRNEPDVHVCVAPDDAHVSRQHGYITRECSRWVLRNTGRLPIRFPGQRLVLGGHRADLPPGFTPLFIVAPKRDHLLEVRVAARAPDAGALGLLDAETRDGEVWELSPTEKLVLVCLAQRYLGEDPWPQPLTWTDVAAELSALRPDEKWGASRAAHIVSDVRARLSPKVPGLREQEIPPPVGNALNHNLIMELLVSTTIVESDLTMLNRSAVLQALDVVAEGPVL